MSDGADDRSLLIWATVAHKQALEELARINNRDHTDLEVLEVSFKAASLDRLIKLDAVRKANEQLISAIQKRRPQRILSHFDCYATHGNGSIRLLAMRPGLWVTRSQVTMHAH